MGGSGRRRRARGRRHTPRDSGRRCGATATDGRPVATLTHRRPAPERRAPSHGRVTAGCVDGAWHAVPARLVAEVLRPRGRRLDHPCARTPTTPSGRPPASHRPPRRPAARVAPHPPAGRPCRRRGRRAGSRPRPARPGGDPPGGGRPAPPGGPGTHRVPDPDRRRSRSQARPSSPRSSAASRACRTRRCRGARPHPTSRPRPPVQA